jgi:branched-chain amino acid aminotransferase
VQNGFDEAIFLDMRGFVSEGSAENLFLVREGTLITPPLSSAVLEGITRRTIIELARDAGVPVVERDVARTELYIADEVFLCGTGAQVAWVSEVDRRIVGDGEIGPITAKLRETFLAAVTGEEDRYARWLTPVF